MAVNPKGDPLVPSILDRLLVDRRGKRSLRHIREFVAQDLENLLNTRSRCVLIPEELDELRQSVVNYGLPDFSGIKMTGSVQRTRLRRLLTETIRRFETRLTSVRVENIDVDDPSDPRLHFRIDAKLNTKPAPEPVTFDSHLEPANSTVEVQ